MNQTGAGFPWYFTIDDRPVKVVATANGGMDVLIVNLQTGELERNMDYLARCFEPGQEVQRISEAEFNQKIQTLRASIGGQSNGEQSN